LLDQDVRELWIPDEAVDYQTSEITFTVTMERPDGKNIPLTVSQTRIVQADEVLFLIMLQMVDETVGIYSQQDERTQTDPLTGLPNRFHFLDQLRMGIATANRYSTQLGIYLVDLNDLQSVNKEYGYRHGDVVLRTVGERMRERLRTNDIISRFGGDEFAVLIPEFKIKGAEAVAQKILSVFIDPIKVNGSMVSMTANIGICVYPGCGDTAESLINNANLALEQSKERGRNGYHVCDFAHQPEELGD
jgi:diguanylate cyclase (GGDEF)-like protein